MTAISYHDTVNDLHGPAPWGKGPFARREWFARLERAGMKPLVVSTYDEKAQACFVLVEDGKGLQSLSNWYAFTWAPLVGGPRWPAVFHDLALGLASRFSRIELNKVADENGFASDLDEAFRATGWLVRREECDTNHYLTVGQRSFADYLATRPGPLRTTLKRKAKKVEVRLSSQFDAGDWAAYEDIYRHSWKPEEGDPALLRAFAQDEAALGHLRFALALADGQPVAAQFWTVEGGTAYIHKLAHLPSAEALSPGTTLTAALMEQVIDRDGVAEVDFGTGNDRYKADWMESVRPRWRLTCLRPGAPRNWPELAKWAVRGLVSPRQAG